MIPIAAAAIVVAWIVVVAWRRRRRRRADGFDPVTLQRVLDRHDAKTNH